jgi:hypothetical protein
MFEGNCYQGEGVNHDGEKFHGVFRIERTEKVPSFAFEHTATRMSDDVVVHRESGFIGKDDSNEWLLTVHMEELPCLTVHSLIDHERDRYVFAYKGKNDLTGFNSELVFEMEEGGFKYLHRWAMKGEVSDKSWCLLHAVSET